jgi:hypothetical protein
VTIVAGTFLLHSTKDMDVSVSDLGRLLKEKDSTIGILSPSSHPQRRALLDLDEGTPMLVHSVDVEGSTGGDGLLGGSGNSTNGRKLAGHLR